MSCIIEIQPEELYRALFIRGFPYINYITSNNCIQELY